ncbi:MAG: LuxR C-terminal-related transcriptional regulator [Actinomycetota bacterium]
MTEHSVIVASGDRLLLEVMAEYFGELANWNCVGRANDGLATMVLAAKTRPDAVLVTDDLSRLGAAPLVRQIRRRWPETRAVIIAAVGGDEIPADVASVGFGASFEQILEALTAEGAPSERTPVGRSQALRRLASLTKREQTVLRLVAQGVAPKDVADRLGVSENTVRTHVQNLYAKLGMHSRLEVARFAVDHGVVDRDTDP